MDGTIKRRKLTLTERQEVYAKTNGHCAYCGIPIELKQMQVDHMKPLRNGGADELDNMFPACRSCNHYKSVYDIETLREQLELIPQRLMRDSVTYQIAMRYGLVNPDPHKIQFYFEKKEEQK